MTCRVQQFKRPESRSGSAKVKPRRRLSEGSTWKLISAKCCTSSAHREAVRRRCSACFPEFSGRIPAASRWKERISGDCDSDSLPIFVCNKIGFVFQDYHLFPRLTTAENVAIPLDSQTQDWDESIAEAIEYLEIVGLKGRADLPPVKLSGGEQQRVAIARAIVRTTGHLDHGRADCFARWRHRPGHGGFRACRTC